MAELKDTCGRLRQNLIDAGCGQQTTDSCMDWFNKGDTANMLPVLAKHRRALLDEPHREQKPIDCLDYLVYTIRCSK